MWIKNISMLAFVSFGLGFNAMAEVPTTQRVEVLIGNIFVPTVGYEEKNDIEVTLDGYLPNACYQLANAVVKAGATPNTFVVHQYADLRMDGVCAHPDTIPVQMRDYVPYTHNLSLGRLNVGSYKVAFNLNTGPERLSSFTVAPSSTMAVDDYPYAPVSAVNMADMVNGANNVSVNLVGTLANSCQYVQTVKVLPEPQDYTIVVLPILGFRTGVKCAQIVLPFEYKVNLGRLGEGRYLLHVRSMNGQAVTRVFSVIRPDPSL